MSLKVAILAGGLATRLHHLTGQQPKSLVEVAGQPFIIHQLNLLRRRGLTDVVLCLGYLGDLIQKYVGNGSRFGLRLTYVFDGPKPLGTGGALRNALPMLGDAFFVLYGDSYLECDYLAIEEAFYKSGRQGLMAVFRNRDQWDKSNVVFEEGKILRYDKESHAPEMEYIDYGLGVLRSRALEDYPQGSPLDLSRIYQDLLARDQLSGLEVKERFYEIGTPAGLKELRKYLSEKEQEKS